MMEGVQRAESEFEKILKVRFKRLPVYDQKFFQYGSVLIGSSAAAFGPFYNKAFRQAMKVRRGFLISSFIVTSLPLLQTSLIYYLAIPNVIMAGKMNCYLCNTLRGTYIGFVAGGLGTASLAALVSTMYFLKYDKRPVPNDWFRFCINLFKPPVMRMKYIFLSQALFSMAVSSRYYTIYEKMLMMPPVQEAKEWLEE